MAPLPPAGWYPDPVLAGTHRYWDGTAWTDESTTAYGEAVAARPPLGRGFARWAVGTQVLLAMCACSLVLVGASSWHALQDEGRLPSAAGAMWSWGRLVLTLLTAACFITWLYRAHRSDRMHAESLDHRSGTAIWSWFVPPVAFWLPVSVVDDVRRAALNVEPPRHGALLGAWWATSVVGLVLGLAPATIPPSGGAGAAHDELVVTAQLGVAAAACGTVAALSAILVVRYLTARVLTSEDGPAVVLPG